MKEYLLGTIIKKVTMRRKSHDLPIRYIYVTGKLSMGSTVYNDGVV